MADSTKDPEKLESNDTQPEGFFDWVIPAFKSRRTMKTWFRCCVALVVTFIFMVDPKVSNTMGQAAFFVVIVAVMLPPSLPLSTFILAITTLLFGMLIGWAWGAAAMAAANTARSKSLLARQSQEAQSSLKPGISTTLQLQSFIFHGGYLDPRSSAVFGSFFFLGTFALGTLRAFMPNLALLSIFGCIVLDIVCTYGPSLPVPQYTLPKIFIIPTAYYVAVALACLVLIFPESLNHVWLTQLNRDFLQNSLDLSLLQSEALNSSPSDRAAWAARTEKGIRLRKAIVGGVQGLISSISLIDLEFSIGRLGPGDLKRINNDLRPSLLRAGGVNSFQIFVNDTNVADEREEAKIEKSLHEKGAYTPNTLDRVTVIRRQIKEREARHGHDLDTLVPILASSSEALREACQSTLQILMDWIDDCNSGRWKAFFAKRDQNKIDQRHNGLTEQINKLESALEDFRQVQRIQLVKPYERFFDPKTKKLLQDPSNPDMFASRSLLICFVFIDTLDAYAECLMKFLKLIADLDAERPKPRLWWPASTAQVKQKISEGNVEGTAGPFSMGTSDDPTTFNPDSDASSTHSADTADEETEEEGEEEKESIRKRQPRKNPDALPPTTAFGKFFLRLGSFLRFFKSAEGIFALRLAIVSLALWVPSVCHSSAWFYYENRGLWALIMAQTGLAIYAGDQIADFFVRIIGTAVGLLLGMVAWYIGAGRGTGNPYGVVIATTVIVAPFLLGRVAAPRTQMSLWTMTGVTVIFVAGYSWLNANLIQLANAGIGVTLGWKRAVLVIIGFTASFIVMLFPAPVSSRVLVRKTFGATTEEAGSLFCGEVEALLAEEARARRGEFEKVNFVCNDVKDEQKLPPKERRIRQLAKKVIAVSERLQRIAPSLTTARFEPQLQGLWPYKTYQELFELQARMISSLVLSVTAFAKLDSRWCGILVHRTPFLNPNLLSDIFSTLNILSSCLTNSHPLPAFLPKLRDRLIFYERHFGDHKISPSMHRAGLVHDNDLEDNGNLLDERDPLLVDGHAIGFGELSLDVLLDENLPAHATAIVALSSFIGRIDELSDVVRVLCGETTFLGFEHLQKDYLDREERMLGTGFKPSSKRD